MKKFIVFCLLLVLVGCSTDNELPSTSTEQVDEQVDGNNAAIASLSEDEAKKISNELIDTLYENILNTSVSYDTETDTETTLEKPDISDYVTEHYLTNYYTDEPCVTEHCTYQQYPMTNYYGWGQEIHFIDENHFQTTTIFNGHFVAEDTESYAQTVDIVKEDGTWKIDDFSFKQQNMNLNIEDIEQYLRAWSFTNVRSIEETTYHFDAKDEAVAKFMDNDFADEEQRDFYVILRTGYLFADVNELHLYFSHYLETESEYLFEDESKYLNAIDQSDPFFQQIIEQLYALDLEREQLHFIEDREKAIQLHGEYSKLLTDTFNYYVQFHETIEGINMLEQDFNSWQYLIEEHYTAQGYEFATIEDMPFQQLVEELYLIRNQIYSTMYYESKQFEQ